MKINSVAERNIKFLIKSSNSHSIHIMIFLTSIVLSSSAVPHWINTKLFNGIGEIYITLPYMGVGRVLLGCLPPPRGSGKSAWGVLGGAVLPVIQTPESIFELFFVVFKKLFL